MNESNEMISGRKRFALVLTLALLASFAVMAYFGVRDSWAIAPRSNETLSLLAPAAFDEVELPQGPHRAEFQTSCLICHSARLVLGQPTLPREKWAEVVHKMVSVYGAAMNPENESHVVEYMLAVQGDR